jgi:hypothetical protein
MKGKGIRMSPILRRYLLNILISIDEFVNTLAGGDPHETISSRVGKRTTTCIFCAGLCWVLNKINKDHCKNAIDPNAGEEAVIK